MKEILTTFEDYESTIDDYKCLVDNYPSDDDKKNTIN